MLMNDGIIKTDFNFNWKSWYAVPIYAKLAYKFQRGSILDVGCATCKLYEYLKKRGWQNKYHGIDIQKYEGYGYPPDVDLIVGDALSLVFPVVDTVILYNILEHVDDPLILLSKAIKKSENVLVHVPKRNEDLWRYGLVEIHQLDKTHKHCGFSKEEVYDLVDLAGGKIINYKEFGEINPAHAIGLWDNKFIRLSIFAFRKIFVLFSEIFSIKTYYQEMWFEVVGKQ